jgi:hypothetical protein
VFKKFGVWSPWDRGNLERKILKLELEPFVLAVGHNRRPHSIVAGRKVASAQIEILKENGLGEIVEAQK